MSQNIGPFTTKINWQNFNKLKVSVSFYLGFTKIADAASIKKIKNKKEEIPTRLHEVQNSIGIQLSKT